MTTVEHQAAHHPKGTRGNLRTGRLSRHRLPRERGPGLVASGRSGRDPTA